MRTAGRLSLGEFSRRCGLFIAAFWLAHIVRGLLGVTGDPLLLPIVQLLTGIGVMTMIALRDPLRDTLAAVTVVGGIAAGCLAWSALSVIDFERPRLRREVLVPLSAAAMLAAALLLFGDGPAGSGAKVNLLGMQPVEVIRPLFIFSLAAYFARRWQFLREFSEDVGASRTLRRFVRLPRLKDVRPLAISIGTLLMFFFLQKDLGPALVLSCVFLGLYGMARAGGALVICGFLGLIAGLVAGYALGVPATITRRVAIWADPWDNALQGGDQIAHAVWALASGGLPGLGLGVGDPQFIPAGHTDLVVAAIGEEIGFVGLAVVIGLFSLLVWRLLRIALRAPGDYTAFLTVGLTLALAVQALVIVGGMLGLLPLAGVVTPFLSYGRSSMLSNLAAVGVCAAVSCRRGAIRQSFAAPVRVLGWTLVAATALLLVRMAHVQVVSADAFATRANLTQQADGGYRYQYNPRLIAAARAIERGTIYDRKGLPLATSQHQELLPFADRYRRLGLTLSSACTDKKTRCYPLGGLAFHVLGESVNQTNWAADNTSFVEEDFDARLKGFDDHPQPLTCAIHERVASRPLSSATIGAPAAGAAQTRTDTSGRSATAQPRSRRPPDARCGITGDDGAGARAVAPNPQGQAEAQLWSSMRIRGNCSPRQAIHGPSTSLRAGPSTSHGAGPTSPHRRRKNSRSPALNPCSTVPDMGSIRLDRRSSSLPPPQRSGRIRPSSSRRSSACDCRTDEWEVASAV